jgi:prepilin-type N-terminal cleavage/methylation domain-containing protein
MRTSGTLRQAGFTIIELMVALGIFLIICGAAFTLLGTSQKRYQSDSQILNSFQEARLGMDQMVRDINNAGYPPPSYFQTQNSGNANEYASTPFAWSPIGAACLMVSCSSPNQFDLIIETNVNPRNTNQVSWIRYRLGLPDGTNPTTLYRAFADMNPGGDPTTDSGLLAAMTPFVQNVMNNAPAAQIAQLQASYPTMFPSGNPVPVFTYACDSSPGTQSCILSGGTPQDIRDVTITLIVMAPSPDGQSGQPRLVQLSGRGRRINPNQ